MVIMVKIWMEIVTIRINDAKDYIEKSETEEEFKAEKIMMIQGKNGPIAKKMQNEKKEKLLQKSKAEIATRELEIKNKNTQFLILGLILFVITYLGMLLLILQYIRLTKY